MSKKKPQWTQVTVLVPTSNPGLISDILRKVALSQLTTPRGRIVFGEADSMAASYNIKRWRQPATPPVVLIETEGGVIQDVTSSERIECYMLDEDGFEDVTFEDPDADHRMPVSHASAVSIRKMVSDHNDRVRKLQRKLEDEKGKPPPDPERYVKALNNLINAVESMEHRWGKNLTESMRHVVAAAGAAKDVL